MLFPHFGVAYVFIGSNQSRKKCHQARIESLKEIERIGVSKYICVESFRNEKEQFNLQCWALTAETILNVKSWKWLMEKANYRGDFEFIFFK